MPIASTGMNEGCFTLITAASSYVNPKYVVGGISSSLNVHLGIVCPSNPKEKTIVMSMGLDPNTKAHKETKWRAFSSVLRKSYA